MAHLYPLSTNLKFVFAFNVCSFTVWFCCLCRFLVLLPLVGRKFLPGGIADFFHTVSVIPLAEFMMVRSFLSFKISKADLWPLLNGIRMAWICYGVIFPHPKVAKHTSYSFLILSWCLTYIIHYAYYSFRIKTRASPYGLLWLNYHHHWITFPIAIVSEMILVFLSLGLVKESSWLELALKFTILTYIPIAYFEWEYINGTRMQRFEDIKKKIISASASSDQNNHSATVRTSSLSPNPENIEMRSLPTDTSN